MPKPELFDLARSIDAHKDSMARSREDAVAGVRSGLISLGEQVTWRAWHFGVPIRMTSRITQMESPDYFVDEQVKGPFRRFRHVHEFSEDSGEPRWLTGSSSRPHSALSGGWSRGWSSPATSRRSLSTQSAPDSGARTVKKLGKY